MTLQQTRLKKNILLKKNIIVKLNIFIFVM